ncbi:aminomethyl-transferring glycine dehydrogenase [Gloeomargaritales cyanobacterium VI4D9]|nr:aminomethyl-transferring glycine dehydrogenase [Gloeomargaritales cyanobacterium VI4D9]
MTDAFARRHLGLTSEDQAIILRFLGCPDLDTLIDQVVPAQLRTQTPLHTPAAQTEYQALKTLKALAQQNQIWHSYLGMGYYNCITPPVIQRNILENPGWYTSYTPYQAEIAQGRLEALFNFQTLITELTGLEIANASLLDEATAAAEAMILSYQVHHQQRRVFWVDQHCWPQTLAVLQTRATALGIDLRVAEIHNFNVDENTCGCLVQCPNSYGVLVDPQPVFAQAQAVGALRIMAADVLSLVLLKPPGAWGADIAVGSTQRLGVPLGYGGPHAAYFATRSIYKRQVPGRMVGLSKDSQGRPALRLALQTREQHIRRERATSNICTAQVLLAVVASMYGVYHGAEGLRRIARQIHHQAQVLAKGCAQLGYAVRSQGFFDTVFLELNPAQRQALQERFYQAQINLNWYYPEGVGISLDETTEWSDVARLLRLFNGDQELPFGFQELVDQTTYDYPEMWARTGDFLTQEVFRQYHSETEFLRYLYRLQSRDLSLTTAMMPLGSCTMKLNATSEMVPISWPEFNQIHPFVPLEQTQGYQHLFRDLTTWLADITGLPGVSLQPNAGSQGELTGLLVIRQYHQQRGEPQRRVCLIPQSAHGTNPASAVMAGFQVVPVACDKQGNVDIDDLRTKASQYADELAALMLTYPSTHGVFETGVRELCQVVHEHGGQVYLDGANLNALVGLCRPGELGFDVCHVNLHKTFCIPHGGGGPGMGPIAVAEHLQAFLPTHPLIPTGGDQSIGTIAAAPWSSASILPISWMYMVLMGGEGLTQATRLAILNANYIAQRLDPYFPVLYRGKYGWVAHECILDLRPLKAQTGVEVEDVAKRLMDYGFHAPTVSWPVAGTMMVEPTESESLRELDRFCEAMIGIYHEAMAIAQGQADPQDNLLKNAPHPAEVVITDAWHHPYSREQAAYPVPGLRAYKFWPPVARIDNAYGDRHLVCSCPPLLSDDH